MSSAVTTVIFDLGNVIVDFDHRRFCSGAAAHCGLSPDVVYEKIFHSGMERRFDSGAVTPEEFFGDATAALDMTISPGLFKTMWCDIFTLNSGTQRLIEGLKTRGLRLACLSNTNPWHFTWCAGRYDVLQAFDAFILSYEQRCCKPDPEIFRRALALLDALPQQCLYIDDIPAYVEAAGSLGLDAVRFDSAPGLEHQLMRRGLL